MSEPDPREDQSVPEEDAEPDRDEKEQDETVEETFPASDPPAW
jgi:hypothetical protein